MFGSRRLSQVLFTCEEERKGGAATLPGCHPARPAMFFPPPVSPSVAAGEAGEEKCTVELRRRRDGEHREPRPRPRTWSRASDSLDKIEESEAESGARNPRMGYSLSGYLYIITSKGPLPALKGLVTAPKKRWFVYSDSVCKLYYYKQKDDSEPLGMIDVSLATFYFDPENKNEGQFSIR